MNPQDPYGRWPQQPQNYYQSQPNNQWQPPPPQAGQPKQQWPQQAPNQWPQQPPTQWPPQQSWGQPPPNQQWSQQAGSYNQWQQPNPWQSQAPYPPPGQPPAYYNSMPYGQRPAGPESDIKKIQETDNAFQKTKFFGHVSGLLQRDYIIILDKSGSMSGDLWRQAKEAVTKLAPFACRADPDGITLYLFSSPVSQHPKFQNIRDPQAVQQVFARVNPGGTTDLAGVLKQAFAEHFAKGNGSPTTILVITDGVPNDKTAVFNEIRSAANRIAKDEELSVTFVQIGNDSDATKFLIDLDDRVTGARFDIVDRVTSQEMNGLTFEQLIRKSVTD